MKNPSSSFPQWQLLHLEDHRSITSPWLDSSDKLIFGLTIPTMAMVVLALFLCIVLETTRRRTTRPIDQVPMERKPVKMKKHWDLVPSKLWKHGLMVGVSHLVTYFSWYLSLSCIENGVLDSGIEGSKL